MLKGIIDTSPHLLLKTKRFLKMNNINTVESFNNTSTKGNLIVGNEALIRNYDNTIPLKNIHLIFSADKPTNLIVDNIPISIKNGEVIALSTGQLLEYVSGSNLIVYRFNKEFYCIQDHDHEVSCAGTLFYNHFDLKSIQLSDRYITYFQQIHENILEEFKNTDSLNNEMLKVLVKQLIISLTRLIKAQQISKLPENSQNELLRQYNLLVEKKFRENHQVKFYAEALFKSPKTLSNTFKNFNTSPLQIIHHRIALEAKRLLSYSEKSFKEIAFDLGFKDPSHLSRLFKKEVGTSMLEFKKNRFKK